MDDVKLLVSSQKPANLDERDILKVLYFFPNFLDSVFCSFWFQFLKIDF
jgi:hypothetical protein